MSVTIEDALRRADLRVANSADPQSWDIVVLAARVRELEADRDAADGFVQGCYLEARPGETLVSLNKGFWRLTLDRYWIVPLERKAELEAQIAALEADKRRLDYVIEAMRYRYTWLRSREAIDAAMAALSDSPGEDAGRTGSHPPETGDPGFKSSG